MVLHTWQLQSGASAQLQRQHDGDLLFPSQACSWHTSGLTRSCAAGGGRRVVPHTRQLQSGASAQLLT